VVALDWGAQEAPSGLVPIHPSCPTTTHRSPPTAAPLSRFRGKSGGFVYEKLWPQPQVRV
jgi:hypothetical protein